MASNKIQSVAPETRYGEEKTLMEYIDRTSNITLSLMGGRHPDGTETYDIVIQGQQGSYCHDTYDNQQDAVKNWSELIKTYALSTLTHPLGANGEPQ